MNRCITCKYALMLCAFGFLFSNSLYSQVSLQWARFYNGPASGNEGIIDMVTDASGNVYVTGSSSGFSPNTADYATIKYNAAGVQQWVARYNGPANGQDAAAAIAIDGSGNIYVTGTSAGAGTGNDLAVVKYNNAGIQQWVARYNGAANSADLSTDVAVDGSGNVYVTGYSVAAPIFPDYVTIKFNSAGVQQWAQLYNGPDNGLDWALGIAVDQATQDVYVTGFSDGIGTDGDFATVKYNAAGVQQWVQRYNGSANAEDIANDIGLDAAGNVYIAGTSISITSLPDYTTIKYNAAGIQQWIQNYNGPANSYDKEGSMVVDPLGNVYVTGITDNGFNLADWATVKYNTSGVQQWVQLYNGAGNTADQANAIALDPAGNVYIAGVTGIGISSYDYLTVKYNPAGALQWAERYDAFNNSDDAAAIAVDIFNDVYVGGRVRSLASGTPNDDYGTIKYVQTLPLTVHASPDTTIYYGYGSHCVQLQAEVTGGTGNYTYSWSPGGSTPNGQTTTVCPTVSTTYTVTVTDANHMTASDQVVVQVIDVRCGNKDKKVMVCHKGNTLCIAEEAVAAHLKHGDKLGACPGIQKIMGDNIPDVLTIHNYPNPFLDQTTIIYELPFDAHVTIKLYDMLGREAATMMNEKKTAGRHSYLFNTGKLPAGNYQCRIIANAPDASVTRTVKMMVIQ